MEMTLYKLRDICDSKRIDSTFIQNLHHNNLITITIIETEEFINESDLANLERYSNWYYELELNLQGIEIVSELLSKISLLQEEIRVLKSK